MGVPRSRLGGLALVRAMRDDPLGTLDRERRPIVRLRLPFFPAVYLVTEPEAIQRAFTRTHREYHKGISRRRDPAGPGIQPLARILGKGLLISEADLHRTQRRLIQPMFHRARIAEYEATFAALAEQAVGGWRDGETRDVHRDMTELTLAIIARTVFDVDLDAQVITTIRSAITQNQPAFTRLASPVGRLLDRLPLPATRRFHRAQDEVNAMLYRLIDARRSAGARGNDVLSLLLAARDAGTGEPMPDRQVRDEAITLLLAGHETTANALAWALHLLATHPQAQTRAADDIEYRTAVWHETLRLFPPAWLVTRRLVEPDDVGGHRLPAGSMLLFSPWLVHRDPRWWPEPDAFRPERWLTPSQRPRYAYFPFGGGPRQCIGNAFADLEGTVVLSTILRRWRVEPAPEAPPVEPLPLVTLRPRNGVRLTTSLRPPPRRSQQVSTDRPIAMP
jgi:cytochrome P450